jgi:hypothetical protein
MTVFWSPLAEACLGEQLNMAQPVKSDKEGNAGGFINSIPDYVYYCQTAYKLNTEVKTQRVRSSWF